MYPAKSETRLNKMAHLAAKAALISGRSMVSSFTAEDVLWVVQDKIKKCWQDEYRATSRLKGKNFATIFSVLPIKIPVFILTNSVAFATNNVAKLSFGKTSWSRSFT